jgi:hypothetical protein
MARYKLLRINETYASAHPLESKFAARCQCCSALSQLLLSLLAVAMVFGASMMSEEVLVSMDHRADSHMLKAHFAIVGTLKVKSSQTGRLLRI